MSINNVERSKKRKATSRKQNKPVDNDFFKDTKDLQNEYELILRRIENPDSESLKDLTSNSDMKYFLLHNDLDYNVFRTCIRWKRIDFIE
jgi:hypothetical protein